MKRRIALIMAAVLAVLLLTGCPATSSEEPPVMEQELRREGEAVSRPPVGDAESPGRLLSFSYSYGSYNGGYWSYELYEKDGNTYFIGEGMNGVDLNVVGRVDAAVMEDLTALMQQHGIFEWNGFSGSDDDVLDGYSFGLLADYGSGALQASGYMKYPRGYEEGHAALAAYLGELAASLSGQEIADKEEITAVRVTLPQGIVISIMQFGPARETTVRYQHGSANEQYTLDEVENYDAFLDFIVDYYNRHKDEPADRESVGGLTITVHNEGAGVDVEYSLSFNDARNGAENAELARLALALVGKTPDVVDTDEFKLEAYKAGFIYPEVYFYDKNGLGAVIVDMPDQKVTVNGIIYNTDQQTMLDLYAVFGGNLYQAFDFIDPDDQIQMGYLEDGQTAQGVFDGFIAGGYTWILGRNHMRDMLLLYGGQDAAPIGWEQAVEIIEAVIAQGEAA